MTARPKVTMTGLRDGAVIARNATKKLVDWIDDGRALAGAADFTGQFTSDLASLVANARKRGIDAETIAAKLREAANALGEEGKGTS